MKRFVIPVVFWIAIALSGNAQSLTPEDIARMVEEQASASSPYLALLNDPASGRSAMKIMLESGDQNLQKIALEAGLLSAEPSMRRDALEYYLKSQPRFRIIFDGSVTKDGNYLYYMNNLGAVVDANNQGFISLRSGEYDAENDCFFRTESQSCLFRIQREGVFVFASNFNGRLSISDDGDLIGEARFHGIEELIPIAIRFLD